MKTSLLAIAFCLVLPLAAIAESQRLFFASESGDEMKRIALTIEGNDVTGTQTWSPGKNAHGSSGTIVGYIDEKGKITSEYTYTIEGSEQIEEQLFKLKDKLLYVGEGELVEEKGKLVLDRPADVTFKTALKKVEVRTAVAGSKERRALMDAMRGPVSKRVGKSVTFTGDVRICGDWARFDGKVATTDGEPPSDEIAAAELELDFLALLKRDTDDTWELLYSNFAGDVSAVEEAREKYPAAPWVLFE